MTDVNGLTVKAMDRKRPSGAAHPPEVGGVLRDRYVLKARLGTGTTGIVFRAQDLFRAALPDHQQDIALKVLNVGAQKVDQAFANLRSEFHRAQSLSHRNVVKVYELDRDGDVVFFTMELLEGEYLGQILDRISPAALGKTQAWQLIRQLCAAVAHAHERGVVHGDLKPQNVFITRQGELRVLDFGGAHSAPALDFLPKRGEASNPKISAYASCEQLEGRRAVASDDLYALACICYELLAGVHPFGSRTAAIARGYQVRVIRPEGVTGSQWRALQQGLSWHRAARSVSVRDWMHKLTHRVTRNRSLTPIPELVATGALPARAAPYRIAGACLATMLVGAAILLSQRPSSMSDAKSTISERADSRLNRGAIDLKATDGDANQASLPITQVGAAEEQSSKPAARPAVLRLSVETPQVSPADHFAEVRVRLNMPQQKGSFAWWTEPATAQPGVDYESVAVPVQPFPRGYHSTRVYVKLLPQTSRLHRSYFYVTIAKTDPHGKAAAVLRKQVWLPASAELQAKR